MRILSSLVVLTALISGCAPSEGTTVAAVPIPAPTSTCPPVHPVPSGPIGAGPGSVPFQITLDRPSYHRIPISVEQPAQVSVSISRADVVRLDEVYAVIVRTGVDISNGPYARRITLLRDAPADGRHLRVTLPATDASGAPLPAGQYLWGVLADYREVYSDVCGTRPTAGSPQRLGQEMPFLVVRD